MSQLEDNIRQAENSIKKGWDEDKKRWSPHESIEGGNKTIGYGHKCTEKEQKQWEKEGLTEEAVNELLKADVAAAKAAVAAVQKSKGIAKLDDNAKEALTELAYNIGQPKLKGFAKMWEELVKKSPDYEKAAAEMKDSKWYRDVGANRGDRMVSSMMKAAGK